MRFFQDGKAGLASTGWHRSYLTFHCSSITYVRKEAVLSSQIEGTQSSLSDILLYENNEAPGVPVEDV